MDKEGKLEVAGVHSPEELADRLRGVGYLADRRLATVLYLSLALERPLVLEGDAGVGKTEVALALARIFGGSLIRLQCYEGIDAQQAVYDWDYPRQILHLKALETAGSAAGRDVGAMEAELYSEDFLIERPLLRSISGTDSGHPPVLLIDEIDRADDEFEAFLLEVLSTFAISIPELGQRVAEVTPIVILTSNRTRELHDALKRRCLYQWVEHPSFTREVEIVRMRAPEAEAELARQATAVVQELRRIGLYKPPGIAETIDWVEALTRLLATEVTPEWLEATIGAVIKHREDEERLRSLGIPELLRIAMGRSGS